MPRPISATVSLPALSHNLAAVYDRFLPAGVPAGVAPPFVWAVIKANAYGHDIENAVRAFGRADGLAMLDLDEAVRCREQGWRKPILLLEGFFEPRDIPVLRQYGLSTSLHCAEQLDMLEAAGAGGAPLDAFVKLDSGMSRLGFPFSQYRDAYARALKLQADGVLGIVGKMTHYARADDDAAVTHAQLDLFNKTVQGLPGPTSTCNSAGTLTAGLWMGAEGPQQHSVRPGICLYGASPFADRSADSLGLRPAMTLAAQLISVRDAVAGTCVGYGQIFRCESAMRIGVVACGYADGYPRHAGTDTPIVVDGVRTRTLGRVSMDMLAVDLGPVPHARVGSPVVLWGEGGPSVDEVAAAAGTIGYELLCAVAPRVPRAVVPLPQQNARLEQA